MATVTGPSNTTSSAALVSRTNYTTLNSIYDTLNKPDVRQDLVKVFGNQMISGVNGLLRFVGATKRNGVGDSYTSQNAGTETREGIRWYEEDRLHFFETPTASAAVTSGTTASMAVTFASHRFIVNDQVLLSHAVGAKPVRAIVTATDSTSITVYPAVSWTATLAANAVDLVQKLGSNFEKGTEMPTEGIGSTAIPRSNTYYIAKYMFAAPASDLANVAWVTNPETGKQEWIWTQESDFRKRVEDYDELMLVAGGTITNAGLKAVSSFNMNGSESLFQAAEARGINIDGVIDSLTEAQNLVRAFDKQAGAGEYAVFVNRDQDFAFDQLITEAYAGTGLTSGVSEQFGTFNNSKEMAVNLGFKSFSLGSYTFHKHDWKLLNDPTLLGHASQGYYKFLAMPMKNVIDPILGSQSPLLEINYKGDGKGYSRDMIHYITGAVPHADYNSTRDAIQFNYTCEKLLAVRGANNIALGAGAN